MGCSESIFVDKSTIDFPIFLLFLNTKFPIFLFYWATTPLDNLKDYSSFLPISNVKFVAKAIEKAVAFKTYPTAT